MHMMLRKDVVFLYIFFTVVQVTQEQSSLFLRSKEDCTDGALH